MRVFRIILLYFILLGCQGCVLDKESNELINIEFVDITPSRDNDSNDYYLEYEGETFASIIGNIIVSNSADKPISFWTMSCSYTDMLIATPEQFRIKGVECNANAPILISLAPNQSFSHEITVEVPLSYLDNYFSKSAKRLTFKVGHLLILENEYDNWNQDFYRHFIENKKNHKIVWGKPIKLKKTNFK